MAPLGPLRGEAVCQAGSAAGQRQRRERSLSGGGFWGLPCLWGGQQGEGAAWHGWAQRRGEESSEKAVQRLSVAEVPSLHRCGWKGDREAADPGASVSHGCAPPTPPTLPRAVPALGCSWLTSSAADSRYPPAITKDACPRSAPLLHQHPACPGHQTCSHFPPYPWHRGTGGTGTRVAGWANRLRHAPDPRTLLWLCHCFTTPPTAPYETRVGLCVLGVRGAQGCPSKRDVSGCCRT